MITTDQIKALRDKTGISVMQCKQALESADGDEGKALELLKKKGAEIAAKKSERTLGAGMVHCYIHAGGAVGTMVELNAETDFVAKHDDFKALAYDVAMHVAAMNPKYIDEADISAEERAVAEALFREEVEAMQKPADVKAKVLEGKLSTYLGERTLLAQPFVKNSDMTVSELLEQATQKFGEKVQIRRFVRFAVLQ
ncbi:MAG: elongation factor Ts [Candidatus Vogelbacteria bacterium CG10_big_fil_rev_8_21_14_0_10_51_16]|uniref:Elongation factor Ts n=1 Tax=Candidatus Vogelbacteria bacterium CG10_big_fil_rev_8_21_14_0_10_51_16 TaxID=1975045 RepID=A0A2H0RFD9_9BACT|nr:MAG: elongation factor Ts [Candidatus Vogelbacteria bacterium CG10_big_fil_rev_8_21_14_0_10_51_16]